MTRFPTWNLFLSILAAALAGVASAIVVTQSLDQYADALLSDRRFSSLSPRKITPLPGTYEEALDTVRTSADRSMVFFVDATLPHATTATRLMDHEAVRGFGVIMSTDGWIVTTVANLSAYAVGESAYEGIEVVFDGERYQVEKIVSDTMTDAVALKVSGASGWPTIGVGDSGSLLSGAYIFGVTTDEQMYATNIVQVFSPDEQRHILSAEAFVERWQLQQAIPVGAPLFGTSGDVVGFVDTEGRGQPLYAFQPFLRQTLRGMTTAHAGLGATVFDLATFSNLDASLRQNLTVGALLLADENARTALITDGPAAVAGLHDGDILLAVDDVQLSRATTLAEILTTYAPGQRATITYMRDGEEATTIVTFGTAEEMIY